MDWLEFLSFLLSPLELGDSEPVVVYGTDYLQQVSELINRTEPRLGGAHSVWGGVQGSGQAILLSWGFRGQDGEALYSQQKQDWELTVLQMMSSLSPNSDLN